ncbi:hypothetical protein DID74_01325 [Candidatus Marinamargulisbacteria bacterium SCGC AG-333-B06]|nr:hypothetical protein DID74_01325 [Candidatus Marinamargulisbacteria bacterium SCGC AG-333-B06]
MKQLFILILPLLLMSCFNQNQSDWIVKINKENITKDEIQIGLNNLSEEIKSQIPQNQQGQYIVNQLIQNEILYQEAVKKTLNLNKEYQNYLKNLTNQFEYQKKQGLIELFIKEKIDSNISVSEQEIVDAFEKNKDTLFKEFEQRSISHIVVKTKEEANEIHRKLKRGNNFNVLAKSKSIDKNTAINNGKIPGIFTKENLNIEFQDDIFNLKQKGNYTQPIQSNAGYHIFKLDNKNTVKAKKYDDVKEYIKNKLFLGKRNQEISTLLNSIKDNYKIEQNEELTKKESAPESKESNKTEKSG